MSPKVLLLVLVLLLAGRAIWGCDGPPGGPPGPPGHSSSAFTTVDLHVNPYDSRPFRKFWRSTGMSSESPDTAQEYLLSRAMKFNLAYIGSLPNQAIKEIRAHWLLELIRNDQKIPGKWPDWNYALLDQYLDMLHENGLQPIFELMGNPGGVFKDFMNPFIFDWVGMVQLVENVVTRYSLRYGVQHVQGWRFETWNEPDLQKYNTMNFTLRNYSRGYFEWVQRGLHHGALDLHKMSVSDTVAKLRLGGPAGTFKRRDNHPICWGMLQECNEGFVTKETCGLDFLTFHKKGGGSAAGVLRAGLDFVRNVVREFPELHRLSFANTEADPLVGWWRPEEWRADVRYGAMVIANVINHHVHWRRNDSLPRLELLSHDNAFINHHGRNETFEQRSLLASFENPLLMVRKPVMAAMALLSYLGDNELTVNAYGLNNNNSVGAMNMTEDFVFLATLHVEQGGWENGWDVSLVYALHNETAVPVFSDKDWLLLKLHIDNVPSYEATGRTGLQPRFQVLFFRAARNGSDGGPMEEWERAGSPLRPDKALRERMVRLSEIKSYSGGIEIMPDGSWSIKTMCSLPEVGLVQICVPSIAGPGPVVGLRAMNVTFNEVLLLWRDTEVKSRCLLTYEVQFRRDNDTEWTSLNSDLPEGYNIRYLSYHVFRGGETTADRSAPEQVRGLYRVRAVDVWGRAGPFSHTLFYPSEPSKWERVKPWSELSNCWPQ